MASIALNSGFSCHKDKRDTRHTLWGSLQYGGIAFPAFEHALMLHPGDVVVFNGRDYVHASIAFPADREVCPWCRGKGSYCSLCLYVACVRM